MGRVAGDVWNDLSYRTTDLLALVPEEQRGEEAVRAFEIKCLGAAWPRDLGSARSVEVGERIAELSAGGEATWDSKVGEAAAHFGRGMGLCGWLARLGVLPERASPSWEHLAEGYEALVIDASR